MHSRFSCLQTPRAAAIWVTLWGYVRVLVLLGFVLLGVGFASEARGAATAARHVFLITADGLRWQEVFRGAEELLMTKENGGVGDTNQLRAEFWRDTPEERRRVLLPFIWGTLASEGVLLGNRDRDSRARVTNGRNFSYPGYSELLTGVVDARIDSNDKKPNPNTNVVEWLAQRSRGAGRAVVFGAWDVFPWILNVDRSGLKVHAGWDVVDQPFPGREAIHEVLRDTTRVWSGVVYDAFVFHAALDAIRRSKPRVAYIAFGETDDWAHEGRYDHYLQAARNFDRFVQRLWQAVQALPEYRGNTAFLLTTDHGRGSGPVAWKNHGQAIAESAFIWVGALGPGVRRTGEAQGGPEIEQRQVAATVAALVGEDYPRAVPGAAGPIREILE